MPELCGQLCKSCYGGLGCSRYSGRLRYRHCLHEFQFMQCLLRLGLATVCDHREHFRSSVRAAHMMFSKDVLLAVEWRHPESNNVRHDENGVAINASPRRACSPRAE